MKSWLKDIGINIVANLAVAAIAGIPSAIIAIGTSVSVVITQTKGQKVSLFCWFLLGLSLFVGIGCLTVSIIYFIKKSKRPVFPALPSDVRYEKAVTELFFKNRENIICNREVKLIILCEKMDRIKKQFTWTGSGYKSTTLEKAMGNYRLIDSPRKHPPQIYEIIFDAVKRCGDKVSYKTKTEVDDIDHVMQPFLSHLVKGPMDYLELRVTAPIGTLKNVKFLEYADTSAEIPISKPKELSTKIIGNLETFECSIKNPSLLHNYRIEWEF